MINQMKRKYVLCPAVLAVAGCLAANIFADDFDATTAAVGRQGDNLITPVNQLVTPAGIQVTLPGMRPNALALSPDGRVLVTSGLLHELLVLDPVTGHIRQHVEFPADKAGEAAALSSAILNADDRAKLSFTGLTFSPDGTRIYLSNVNGDIKVFGVSADGTVSALYSLPLPAANAPTRKDEIPAGIAVSADGKKIYVAGNLSNRLIEMDAATGRVLRIWNVGMAPYDVVLRGNKAYVSNWGGRRPDANSLVAPAGQGMRVRVDANSVASEGSVSVIDLSSSAGTGGGTNALPSRSEFVVGPHACAMALSPKGRWPWSGSGRWLVVASAGSDTLSIVDTRSDTVVETVSTRQNAADLFGAQPNALAFDASGEKLYVANGTQNAVAVFQFDPGSTQLLGLIPVGWFPGGIAYDVRDQELCVANIKSLPMARQMPPRRYGRGPGFNTHQFTGSLSLVPVPSAAELARDTQTALADLRYPLLAAAKLPARPGQAPVPVPERVGEPSVFQHVIYIIKENRSYDEVLGDATNGNGDPDLCIFGEHVTPNEHKIVRDFCLLDNMYCSSILSADGHNWADSAMATDYLEREFAGWARSYPAGGDGEDGTDALAFSPAGFIWTDAGAHGRSVVNFGEFTTDVKHWKDPNRKGKIRFLDTYRDFTSGANQIAYYSVPDIESLRPYTLTNTIGWDLEVPDVWRAHYFTNALQQYEQSGNLPNLIIIWLPNDHTSGTKPGVPTPEAQVADNDLAMGQIFSAVSHSIFWSNTCIFAVEDDPQNGWDHVSGYRTTAYVASPYTKRNAVVATQYNQTSLLRTMELILGVPPMNQMDATATPMFDCFTSTPDYTPFESVANNIPLDQMNKRPEQIKDSQLRKDAYVSAKLPLDKEDQCPEDLFNHILWRAVKGSQVPYPNWAVKPVDAD